MRGLFVPAVLLGALLLAACETSVAPRAGADRHFSLYGVLNPTADSQAVLVFPIENELRALPDEPLGVRVTTTDLAAGQQVVWQDSTRMTDEGAVHVYWSRFRVEHDRSYRLNVVSEDGSRNAEVTVHVPPQAEIVPGTIVDGLWVTQDIEVTAPIDRLNFLKIQYVIKAKLPASNLPFPVLSPDQLPPFGTPPPPPSDDDPSPPTDTLIVQRLFVPIEYSDKATVDGAGWKIPINYSDDFREIRRRVSQRGNADPMFGIQLEAVEVSFVAANAEWQAPEDVYDAEVLVQPGTMTNVSGGFGFVGAGYPLSHSFVLPDDILVRIGFRLPTSN
ncbi:MAG: hypothetical protein JJ896_13980 [Rhodothermales bacterium]|nr:hypothetical protein [Rhodothermales bacterium]MBO6780759.1 hypothetical protein [Rhodothermales bacterium]